ncbi:hypothetical protein BP6252_08242 [Coleophoma cylindrospora]|uniref:C2H2-type domain-containing protein n=1 Tax=Coleophoma cylindrospora TaxID=1849047 RepID=A0A3D8R579_9HELO|nr:hypothetical protein BP6252_08242 [Coleophoma cylindrospora]
MQEFSPNENLANQMDSSPTSVLPIGGTEAGSLGPPALNIYPPRSRSIRSLRSHPDWYTAQQGLDEDLTRDTVEASGPNSNLFSAPNNPHLGAGFENNNPSIGNKTQSPSFVTPPNSGSHWSFAFSLAANDNYLSPLGPLEATLNAAIPGQQQIFDDNYFFPLIEPTVPSLNTAGPAQQQVFDNYIYPIAQPVVPTFNTAAPAQQQVFDNYIYPIAQPVVPTFSAAAPAQQQLISCSIFPCTKTFTRDADRIRHETTASIHNRNRDHLCAIPGCRKGQDGGFSRADKLKEHMWKKHADLGYAKKA